MNYRDVKRAALTLVWVAAAVPVFAQGDMRGHWSATLDTPAGAMAMEVDLNKVASGWIGSIAIPAQGVKGLPLDGISFSDGKGTFHFKGVPGGPGFSGTLSADGKRLEGNFNTGPTSLPITLTRTGDARVEEAKASPPLGVEFVGTWEGTIQQGPGLRVLLKISNGKAGAEAAIVSLDQGNVEIAVSAVRQQGTKLTLEVNAVGGGYSGEINKEGTELRGTWTQLGMSTDLQFKKSAK